MSDYGRGYKGSSINQHNIFAEREVTLTDIDSMFQNGEIGVKEARELTVTWAVQTDNVHLLPSILG